MVPSVDSYCEITVSAWTVAATFSFSRSDLAKSLSRVIHSVFQDRYGPLVGALSEPTLNEALKSFESNLARAKGDVTLVAQELLDRVIPPQSKRRR